MKTFEQNGIRFENRDCMDALRGFADDFFDLAIVDPPYGGGFTEGGGCKGWFTKYHRPSAQTPDTDCNKLSLRGGV